MSTNNYQPTVEASNPSKNHTATDLTARSARQSPTPRRSAERCCPAPAPLTLREATRQLRQRYGNTVSELELGLLAIAWLDHQPLHAGTSQPDRLILRWAAHLVEHQRTQARPALAAARAVARDRLRRQPPGSSNKSITHFLTLDEALRIPELTDVLKLDELDTIDEQVIPDPTFILVERHKIGSDALELWELPPSKPEPPIPTRCSAGELIGTCIRCGAGVGDDEWTFAAWDGKDWRFSGRTLPEAQRLAALRPLLCSGCAVRAKYKLIPAPEVESKASSSLLPTDQRRDRDVAVHRSKHRQVVDPTTTTRR